MLFVCFLFSFVLAQSVLARQSRIDSNTVAELRKDIESLIREKSCAPILVRLAWHDSGTYEQASGTGGPNAGQRFAEGESQHAANTGLNIARNLLNEISVKYSGKLPVADLWTFAGTVAIESSGGPKIDYRFGRTDVKSASENVPEGRLPDGNLGINHLRTVFYRMGFNDRDIVTLSGAHTLGGCHLGRSGFDGPWTDTPLVFDNSYFVDILNRDWIEGPVPNSSDENSKQFMSETTMMMPSDLALLADPGMKSVVEEYAQNQDAFFNDFAIVWKRLIELGYSDDALYSVEETAKGEL